MADMHNAPIASGQRYGRLTVIAEAVKGKSERRWLCRCECGKDATVQQTNLRNGHSQSCGCLAVERISKSNTTHGFCVNKQTPREYWVWASMIQRCHDAHTKVFHYYGGRGIAVCERWRHDFGAFYADMGPRPSSKHSIDRIDTDGHYEPGNCRWATKTEQMNNMRSNRLINYDGRTQTLAAWAREYSVNYRTLHQRLKRGKSFSEAISRK